MSGSVATILAIVIPIAFTSVAGLLGIVIRIMILLSDMGARVKNIETSISRMEIDPDVMRWSSFHGAPLPYASQPAPQVKP